nr:protoporphyrinogen oxidase [Thermoanaerobacterales bacterium]
MSTHVDLAVVGGGISGLAAAWEGERRGASVAVLEAADRPGGKLQTSSLAGVPLDEAADAFLARVPAAVELCDELGIATELVAPASVGAYVWLDGRLRKLPPDQVLGVPTDLDAVAAAGLLSPAGVERAREDLTRPDDRPRGPDGEPVDESVGDLVRRRLGDEVLDRLVGPLVGSVYAGDCDRLSLQVVAAQLAAARDLDPAEPSLIRSVIALRDQAPVGERPLFLAPREGMGALVGALVDALGDAVRTGTAVEALVPEGTRWRLAPTDVTAGAVVLTTPAFATAPLLAPLGGGAAEAAAVIGEIDHASVALVSLAVPRDGVEHELDGTGFLVPRSAGLLLTACSWVTTKWPHLDHDPSLVLLRASVGRDGDERALGLTDDELVARVLDDLGTTMGLRAAPVEVRVSRWPRSFPQPRPGHRDRVAAAEAALARSAPRIVTAGAWTHGVGVPTCIRTARAATARALGATTGA